MRDESHRLVIVELRNEGFQNLGDFQRLVGARVIGAIAPVLPCSEKENLDAGLTALGVGGENIRFINPLWINALMGLHMAERRQPVAVDGGTLEIECLGRCPHLSGELGLH